MLAMCLLGISSCGKPTVQQQEKPMSTDVPDKTPVQAEPAPPRGESPAETETKLATFGGGCFWCVEAVFQQLEGVVAVQSGYAGGTVDNPTYKQVCSGTTGHAEVCQIRYDPAKISFDELLEAFWKAHDPTTLNQQGADVGTQYRSVIFYHDDQQRSQAEKRKQELDASGAWADPIVTEISPLLKFYPAEDYHQNYFRTNPQESYCQFVIRPKLEKFEKVFASKLKKKP